jgi:hypothetical protein
MRHKLATSGHSSADQLRGDEFKKAAQVGVNRPSLKSAGSCLDLPWIGVDQVNSPEWECPKELQYQPRGPGR